MTLLPDKSGVLAGWLNQYVIEDWSRSGVLRRVVSRKAEWFPPWWDLNSDRDGPPRSHLRDLSLEGDTLWVMLAVSDRDRKSENTRRPSLDEKHDRDAYRDMIIEAIHLESGVILASTRFPELFTGFVGPGLAYRVEEDERGHGSLTICRVTIHSSHRRES